MLTKKQAVTVIASVALAAAISLTIMTAPVRAASPAATSTVSTADAVVQHRIIVHVDDAETSGKWKLAINNINNLRDTLGAANVQVELVAYGPGIKMLANSNTAQAAQLKALADSGVVLAACQNSMKSSGLTSADMLPFATQVPSGAAEIVKKETEGWGYLKP